LIDPVRFHLDVTVDEIDVVHLAIGQPVAVAVDALPDLRLTGRVDRLAPTAPVSGGLVHYAVRIVLDPPPLATAHGRGAHAALRSGMSALAQITVAEARDVVLVPNWAIRRDRRLGQAYASLRVGDELIEVPITTGLRGDLYTEVVSGVKEGDMAAVSTARDRINLFGGGG
jgi:HlyD family secretion protein